MDRWKKILKQLRALGYKGIDDDIEAVKKFLAGENDENEAITLSDANGKVDIEAAFKASKKPKAKAVTIDDESEDDADDKVDYKAKFLQSEARAKGHGEWAKPESEREEENAKPSTMGFTPKGVMEARASKAYDRRVASNDPSANFNGGDEAAVFAAIVRYSALKKIEYPQKQRDREIIGKIQVEYDNQLGGSLVPEDFRPTLFRLREKAGGGHMLAEQVEMSRDTLEWPRDLTNLSVGTPGEAGTLSETSATFDKIKLVATKRGAYARFSSELLNDGALNIADILGEKLVYALEADLENAYINGDGTSTYWGVVGLGQKFQNTVTDAGGTWATDAGNLASVTVGSGNLWSELVQGDFDDVVSKMGDFDIPYTETWLCNKRFWHSVVVPKIRAAGGTVYEAFQNKIREMYNGAPVVTSTKMPRNQANSQFCAFYGDFRLASAVGRVRNSFGIATSDQVGFLSDTIYIRGLHRAAITVHDVGNYSATASSRVLGPIVGLVTAAS